MRRVSSRQRLVSWDRFDASINDDSSSEEYVDDSSEFMTCYDDNNTLRESYPSFASLTAFSFHDDDDNDNACHDDDNGAGGNNNTATTQNSRKRERSYYSSSSSCTASAANIIKKCLSPSSTASLRGNGNGISTTGSDNNVCNGFAVNTLKSPTSLLPPNTIDIVPAFSHEINNSERNNFTLTSASVTASSTTGLSFNDLMDDAQLHILSFVDAADARSMLSTCKQYYHLLKVSKESYVLWIEYYNRLWPKTFSFSIQSDHDEKSDDGSSLTMAEATTTTRINIRDDLNIPIGIETGMTDNNQKQCDDRNSVNLSALMGMCASAQPDSIDESKFVPSNRMYYLRRAGNRRIDFMVRLAEGTERVPAPFKIAYINTANSNDCATCNNRSYEKQKIIQYTGPVGPGDRCIVSNQPFPKPKFVKPLRKYSFDSIDSSSSSSPSILDATGRRGQRPLGTHKNDIVVDGSDDEIMMPYVNTRHKQSLVDFFCRSSIREMPMANGPNNDTTDGPTITPNNAIWRPFVVPYVTKYNIRTGEKEVNLTPRLVAYYEVTIHEKSALLEGGQQQSCSSTNTTTTASFAGDRIVVDDEHDEDDDDDNDNINHPMWMNVPRRSFPDCVAVGISSSGFHLHSKMPGWDTLSYGYHGDDGGLFHGSGSMVKQYGPSFGCGDTVGCGIDYVTGGIFFTLNGSFLGYGWSNIDPEFLQSDLYPTIGVDTNCPLSVNFGNERPFKFDLTRFIKRQEDIVKYCITPLTDSYDAIDNAEYSA